MLKNVTRMASNQPLEHPHPLWSIEAGEAGPGQVPQGPDQFGCSKELWLGTRRHGSESSRCQDGVGL